ncbi:MAG: prepilin-type N-terminal cleavage/methylation domain-containing protein [Nitrospirota bacterium]
MKNAKLRNSRIFNFEFSILNFRLPKAGGFTLIELLLAFAILSVILATLYSTFFLSHKALDGIDSSLLKLQECRATLDVMRREVDSIHSLLKVDDRDIYGRQTSRLVFTAFSSLRPGLSMISYFIEEKDGKLILLKEIDSAYMSDNKAESVEIIEDVEAFMVEVKYNDKWVKTWDSFITHSIPQEIRITLTTKLKNKTVSLFETVRPKIGRSI